MLIFTITNLHKNYDYERNYYLSTSQNDVYNIVSC